MTQLLFVFCVGLSLVCAESSIKCGSHEEEDDCPTACAVNSCPKQETQETYCEQPKVCPQKGCKCMFNYRRAENGTCISTWNCPAFPCERPNEEYVPCPPYCPSDSCEDASLHGNCQFLVLLVRECFPTCRCKKGHWRLNGTCVPFEKCPKKHNEFIPLYSYFI